MTDAPERIRIQPDLPQHGWAQVPKERPRVDYTGWGAAQDYVLASVADEDRRKLGVAVEALKAAEKTVAHVVRAGNDHGNPMPETNASLRKLRAAIAEIEGTDS